LSKEEGKKLSCLEKRLVTNIDFDDQALNSLGFGTDIYYMLGHLGWVQSPTGFRQTPTTSLPCKF
jgi:hypothetical protein